MSWWLQVHAFPKFTFRFNNSLERQNLLKAITLTITFITKKGCKFEPAEGEAYRVESRRGSYSSCPFHLSTPCGVLDSVTYSWPQYTHNIANQESSLMLWCPTFYWSFIIWHDWFFAHRVELSSPAPPWKTGWHQVTGVHPESAC